MEKQGKHTTMYAYKSLPEGTLAELIDNVLHEPPAPTYGHQATSSSIFTQLYTLLKDRAIVIPAPFDVYLDEVSNAVQPDITVILNGNGKPIEFDEHFHGVPDLVVEILSRHNRAHDQVRKKQLYERFGVKEYWIVDPGNKQAMGYFLRRGVFELGRDATGILDSPLLNLIIHF